MIHTTLGQLLVNEALPEDLRDYDRVLDKKGARDLLRAVAQKYPERYRDVSFKLSQIGHRVSQETGGMSFGLQHMRKSVAAVKTRQKIDQKLAQLLDDDTLPDQKRNEMIVRLVGQEMKTQQDAIFDEAKAAGNPLATQVISGSRGNKMNLASLLGSDLLYSDHHDRPIPIPVLRSYAEGLAPEEYFAGAYGARKGTIATKFATQDAGFFGKQLNQIGHRLVVVGKDYDDEEQRKIIRGVPVDIDDMDNEGALLAQDVGPYKRNTALTPKIIKHLSRLGKKRVLVRSTMVGGSPEGGIYAADAGVRERGLLPGRGEQVGLMAAQALSEPISQGQLSAKHSGGVAGEEKAVSGFDYINQLVQVPKHFKGGAAHAHVDGTVQRIEPAPAGGQYLVIDGEQHYVAQGYDLKVQKGDTVEAGDVISEGLPNPSEITHYKGVGEGRRYFVKAMREAMLDANMPVHRRNLEVLARGLINHVRLTDEYGENVPDDVVPYSTLEHRYKPRDGHLRVAPKQAVGKYLEAPVLHYTIGTKIRPSMLQDFNDFGINEVVAHDEPPPFEPEMIRGMFSLQHDPDWMTRQYGSGLKKGLLDAAHRGSTSNELGTSFVPSLSRSVDFGRQPGAIVKQPEIGYKPDIGPEKDDSTSTVPFGAVSAPKQTQPPKKWFGGKFTIHPTRMRPLKIAKDRVKRASMPNDPTKAFNPQTQSANKPVTPAKPSVPTGQATGSAAGYQQAVQRSATPAPAATTSGIQQAQQEVQQENPYSWASTAGNSPNLMQTPFGAPLVQNMERALPGMGGVIGLGTLLNSKAMASLTRGTAAGQKVYGAAGYNAPGTEGPAFSGQAQGPEIEAASAPSDDGGSWWRTGANVLGTAAAVPMTTGMAKDIVRGSPTLQRATQGVKRMVTGADLAPETSQALAEGGKLVDNGTKVLTRTGKVLRVLNKAGTPLALAMDAGMSGYRILNGESQQMAEEHANEVVDKTLRFWNPDAWEGPVSNPIVRAVSMPFEPVKNVNTIAQSVNMADQAAGALGNLESVNNDAVIQRAVFAERIKDRMAQGLPVTPAQQRILQEAEQEAGQTPYQKAYGDMSAGDKFWAWTTNWRTGWTDSKYRDMPEYQQAIAAYRQRYPVMGGVVQP